MFSYIKNLKQKDMDNSLKVDVLIQLSEKILHRMNKLEKEVKLVNRLVHN